MEDFLKFAFDFMNNVWSACKWIAPALVIDIWLKQDRVDQRLNEIQESVNELNEDDSDYSE